MQERDYREVQSGLRELFTKGMTERVKAILNGVPEKVKTLADFDLTKAQPNCNRCNGTGILRHANVGGTRITIVCDCTLKGGKDDD